jgi:spermidine synthase
MRRLILHGLFFLSGVSAVTCELAWQRQLNLLFGVSTLSVSAVLAAFMGGLAGGGLLFGRLADRSARPLRLYAFLELGIGLTGLSVPAALAAVTAVYPRLHHAMDVGPWGSVCLRFGLALLVLAVPTTLMGGTLPVMGRLALRRSAGPSAAFSLLYGVNTLGAVLGAALTGFVLLRFCGLQQTIGFAAAVSLLVALAAGLAGRGTTTRTAHVPTSESPRVQVVSRSASWPVLACAAATGATCMGLEVAWSRILGILTSNSAYGFALLLTVLLSGLALGSLVLWVAKRLHRDAWKTLAFCQWLLAGVTLASLPYFRTTPEWLVHWCDGGSAAHVFAGELVLTAAGLLVPALLMGMGLPLLVAGAVQDPNRFGICLGRLSGVNTLGAVAGAFLAGFVLIPWLGIQATLGLLMGLALVVGLYAWLRAARPALAWRCLVAGAVVGAATVGWTALPPGEYSKSAVDAPRSLLYYREGNSATVAVVQEASGMRTVLVDGQPVAGTGAMSVVDQKMLAHLPLLLHPAPHRALTVGFGSGGTSYSMTLHGIDVDCVEIEAAVPGAAEWFRSENDDVLGRPRYRLIVDDVRSWLRVAPEPYDVIATDCTNIQYRSNGDLYTVDYFRLMKDRLTADGLAAAWVPANGIDPADLKTLLRSFRTVFPHTSVWYMNALPTDFLIVIGSPRELHIDFERMSQRMREPAVAEDLAAVGLADPCRLLYTFMAAEGDLDAYLGAGPLNTDDQPVLSYSTYGTSFRGTIGQNLVDLMACRSDVARFVYSHEGEAVMLRHYAASNEVLLGHVALLAGSAANALPHYVLGAQLLPRDSALQALVVVAYRRMRGAGFN